MEPDSCRSVMQSATTFERRQSLFSKPSAALSQQPRTHESGSAIASLVQPARLRLEVLSVEMGEHACMGLSCAI